MKYYSALILVLVLLFMKRSILGMLHKKCRNTTYPRTNLQRFSVPDDKVLWTVEYPEYSPINYTSEGLKEKPWADPIIEDPNFKPKWNELDGNGQINRISYNGLYSIDNNNYPQNPFGRTGMIGRGLLGRWGPNHAADPIVTRWKKLNDNSVKLDEITNKPILQFVGIQRNDSGEWAIPGGMVDPGEKVSVTLRREFMEEATNSLMKNSQEMERVETLIRKFFEQGEEIYKGYVDDPRNTDNAWMETVAYNFHDNTGKIVENINFEAGDDAKNVRWIDINNELILYASHKDLVIKVAEKKAAHW
ncbi:ADP-ribose pyrophosphatase, mitochondrial isoform X2 [Phymastichus coffea]|uniref:ADP-ribose pyrophosphatase, mitochondrial isoform X2 n=1 Tax=Phymastichus coffea TaxID=108790 RepID=UPI00273C56AB|nr:ADP-ribose pyrophosphatase, mitochondrial isoform X2 [Phymastichus coffea]